ncbi:hypothetical protein BJ928_102245 [Rhizobium sp. WW_1]|nr:hypothetical protein BJ928_102245 [Rhizobium sp. WW_1]
MLNLSNSYQVIGNPFWFSAKGNRDLLLSLNYF